MHLTFPDIDPIAFSLGPFDIRWYALAYLVAFLLGWKYCAHLAGENNKTRPNTNDIEDFLPWVILGVILGGRIGYVLFYNFDLYTHAPLEALKLWKGGMSFHGGALGVILAMILYSRARQVPFLRLSDIIAAAVPIGLFLGRIANFINGELYGRITDVSWAVVFPHAGEFPRHPSQIYEALSEGVLLFVILFCLIKAENIREKPGIVSGAFLLSYGIFRFLVEYVRAPDAHIGYIFSSFSMGQVLSLPMILLGLGTIFYAYKKAGRAG